MALFSKEPDNNAKSREAVKPTTPTVAPMASSVAPQILHPEERVGARPGPVASQPTSGEARAYLDKGSKISGKLWDQGINKDRSPTCTLTIGSFSNLRTIRIANLSGFASKSWGRPVCAPPATS